MSKPPVIQQRITNTRLWMEILIAAVIGGAFCFLLHRVDSSDNYSFIAPLAVGFLLGIFGRGLVFLVGPATMFGVIIWSPIDLLLRGDGHPFWPFEMLWYGVMSLIGLAGAAIGRWIKRKTLKH